MVETGTLIFSWLIFPLIALPFITAILIFFKQAFKDEALTLLMLVCLLLSIQNLLFSLNAFEAKTASLFYSLFTSAEFTLLIILFRTSFQNRLIKEWINYVLVAFLSIVITLHITKTTDSYLAPLPIVEAVLLVFFSLASLLILIRNQYMFIFHSPLFWIAGGTVFYFIMQIAAELLQYYGLVELKYKPGLLASFGVIRFIFYLIAAIIKQPKQVEEDWKNFKDSSPEHRR